MDPADIPLHAYDYALPAEYIAQQPTPERGTSRLLVLDRAAGELHHRLFVDLPDLLHPGDLLVVNRSRVIRARLRGTRPNGGSAEVLLVRRHRPGIWSALVRPGRRLRAGMVVTIAPDLRVELLDQANQAPPDHPPAGPARGQPLRLVRLYSDAADEREALQRHGHLPLPPYIQRADTPTDHERYQTVYSAEEGSVAAPTAGLHFTRDLIERLARRGIDTVSLVLHVGPGTFRPVEVDDVREHRVAAEEFDVPATTAEAVNRARAAGRRVVAVGTTATRALEAATDRQGRLVAGPGETALVIVPGHDFVAANALITNFHLPRSSLLLLVAAFAGRQRVLAAYAAAIAEGYRFYSYGDAMLIT